VAAITSLISKAKLPSHIEISSKQFRHNLPTERQNVVSEIESVCLQLNLLAKPLPTDMDSSFPLSMLTKIQKQPLDGYDVIMVDSINRTGVINIITDDGDYACVPGIRIFTANHNVIQKARAGGSLITRSAASTSSTAS